MKRKKYYARTSQDEISELRRITMAKDHLTGKVSNPDGGFYKSSEEIRAESAEKLTRSEIFNTFGEDIGQKLIDGGYASLSGLAGVTDDELLAITGIGPASVEKIREVISLEPEEESGLEEETPDEPEVEETVDGESEAIEPVVEEEEIEEVSEEVLPEEPAEEVEPESADSEGYGEPEPVPEPLPAPVDEVPFGAEGAMSVRVRRNKERAAREEAERKRQAAISDSLAPEPQPKSDQVFELGSVGVDFVPEGTTE